MPLCLMQEPDICIQRTKTYMQEFKISDLYSWLRFRWVGFQAVNFNSMNLHDLFNFWIKLASQLLLYILFHFIHINQLGKNTESDEISYYLQHLSIKLFYSLKHLSVLETFKLSNICIINQLITNLNDIWINCWKICFVYKWLI